ncbi:MAG: PHP domain-containing protein [Candidatus Eremiobacteraeota bacterium]|nr:PHP domain-containing protein [Candidatus Eremiobacteraeota bacterium]
MLIDLHMHTTCSDGVWPRERLFDEIRLRELDLFCVSDHDTLAAYPMTDDLAARSIPGLEVDTEHAGHTVHLLAYGVRSNETPLMQALTRQRQEREKRMGEMIERLHGLGIAVTLDDVRAQATSASSLGRPHLARALVARGHVATVQEAFDRYLADEGTGFVALRRLTSAEIIELIRASGGVSVVAHPKRLRAPHHLDELRELGVDGVEVVHPTADADFEREMRAFAEKHDLLVTGGTDFHAPVEHPIGIEFPKRDVERLAERIAMLSGGR